MLGLDAEKEMLLDELLNLIVEFEETSAQQESFEESEKKSLEEILLDFFVVDSRKVF